MQHNLDGRAYKATSGQWSWAIAEDDVDIVGGAGYDTEADALEAMYDELAQIEDSPLPQGERERTPWQIRDQINPELLPHGLAVDFESSEANGSLNLYCINGSLMEPVMVNTTMGATVKSFDWSSTSQEIVVWWQAHSRRGVDWWNGLEEQERAHWLEVSGSAVPAKAWAAYLEGGDGSSLACNFGP